MLIDFEKYINFKKYSFEEIQEKEEYKKLIHEQLDQDIFISDNVEYPHYVFQNNELLTVYNTKIPFNKYHYYFKNNKCYSISKSSVDIENLNLPIKIEYSNDSYIFQFDKKSHPVLPLKIVFKENKMDVDFNYSNIKRFKEDFRDYFKDYFLDKTNFFENPDIKILDYIQLIQEK